jgi:hypothetical protein
VAEVRPPRELSGSFKVGDVVYVDGASALLGDVEAVEADGVHVTWRRTETVEQPDDLNLADEQLPMTAVIDDGEVRVDATAGALALERDGVLQSLADGELNATEQTRRLAQSELDYRKARR